MIISLKALYLLNMNIFSSFATLPVLCGLHGYGQDCQGPISTFFSSPCLLLVFSRPPPTFLLWVWPCDWPVAHEQKKCVLHLGRKPPAHPVLPLFSYLHLNGLGLKEGRTCRKKEPGCLNDCEERAYSQPTWDCAASQKQTWSQATESVGLFVTALSLL